MTKCCAESQRSAGIVLLALRACVTRCHRASDPANPGPAVSLLVASKHWSAAVSSNELLPTEIPFVLGGDYNICPTDDDCYDPVGWADDALCRPESRARFRALLNLGLTEAWRTLHKEVGAYSYWDYQSGRWQRDEGVRIDHFLLSPQAADRLRACEIDRRPRGKEKASDHTPVWCEIATASY